MDREEIYRDCLADIESFKSLFDGSRCRDVQLARQELKDLKFKWNDLVRRLKGTEAEGVVQEALMRLPNAKTRPDCWLSQLYEAGIDFWFRLGHPSGRPGDR